MAPDTSADAPVRAACYCRISSDPNDKREGVTRQRQDTAALCEVKGWQVADVYIDNDRSASNGKDRPEWERLLADIDAGKIDAVAAWDQDRVNRMMEDFIRYKKLFVRRRILLATSNNGDIDLSTPSGVLTATIKTAVAEQEIAMMKVRMRRAARQKAEQGRPQWKNAFGYLPELRRRQDDDGTRTLDPKIAPLVRDGYAAIVAGASLKDVAAMWNDAGALGLTGKPWNESLVGQFIRKPRNAGLRTHTTIGPDGKEQTEIVGKGTWPPLVDESLWRAAVQTMDARPSGGRGVRRPMRRHLLTGMMNCRRCGDTLSGQWVKRKTGGKPGRPKAGEKKEPHPGDVLHCISYACRGCRGVAIRAGDVEPLLMKAIGGRLAMPDATDLLKSEVHDADDAQRIRDEKQSLYGELDKLAIERANNLLTARQVHIASEVIQQKIDALERSEQDQERLRVFTGIPLGTPRAVAAVAKLSPDRFRAIMRVLMTVTIEPAGRGRQPVFNPQRVTVEWFTP
jgi:DNA invertase Pin-like site-specific DNA recombinase